MPNPTPPLAEPPAAHDDCPVQPLGLTGNHFLLLDFAGIERLFPASVLHSRDGLLDLFGGDAWLRDRFPKNCQRFVSDTSGQEKVQTLTVDFQVRNAAEWLIEACKAVQPSPAGR